MSNLKLYGRPLLAAILLWVALIIFSGIGYASVSHEDPLRKIDPLLKGFMQKQGISVGAKPGVVRKSPYQPRRKGQQPTRPVVSTARPKFADMLAHRKGANGQEMVSVVLQLREGVSPETLAIPNLHIRSTSGQVVTAELPVSEVITLAENSGVASVGASRRIIRTNDVSIPSIGANVVQTTLHTGGKGALVGVADTGVDWRHQDFVDADGKSRILYIWDQTDSTGPPPAGYDYGTEFTKSQIDAALAGSGSIAEADNDPAGYGHGTHVLGTAAGNGRAVGKFTGVAPESQILFVKLNWDTAAAIDANKYMLDKAAQLGKPIAINNSWGDRSGPHDGTSPTCVAFDALAGPGKPGKVICFGVGNDGGSPYHVSGDLPAGSTGDYLLTAPMAAFGVTDVGALTTEIWYPASAQIAVGVGYLANGGIYNQAFCNPGERIEHIVPGSNTSDDPFMGATLIIDASQSPLPSNPGMRQATVSFDLSTMSNPDDLDWALIMLAFAPLDITVDNSEGKSDASFDAWATSEGASIASDDQGQTFRGDTDKTLLDTATANNVISVGAYVTKTGWTDYNGLRHTLPGMTLNSAATFTSLGPTRTNGHKPDISAPGQLIVSTYSADAIPEADIMIAQGGKHQVMQGTSMSCPHVTGACALLLEVNPNLDAAQVKQILTSTAKNDGYTGATWNATWGYGKLDTNAAVRSITKQFTAPNNYVRYGWNLFSLPGEPENPDPLAVLAGINVPGSSLQYWDNVTSSGKWIGYGSSWSGPLQMGAAYWLLNTAKATTISYKGKPRLEDQSIQIPSHSQAPYWIMFGHPYDHSVACDSVKFSTNLKPTPLQWEEAYRQKLVESKALVFDSAAYRYYSVGPKNTTPERTSLEPWCGYWLLVDSPGALTIQVPAAP